MLEKIISAGQTGAALAALDAALELGIPHGGWISKGRFNENGPLSRKYALTEMATENKKAATQKNIRESDGTLVLSHGKLGPGPEYARTLALQYGKPFLWVDFYTAAPFDVAVLINNWLVENDIKSLHVTGPRASTDPKIYTATQDIMEAVSFLSLSENNLMQPHRPWLEAEHPANFPRNIDEAVEDIIAGMDLRDRALLANLSEPELAPLQLTLGMYIKNCFEAWSVDNKLMDSYKRAAREEGIGSANVAMVTIKLIWKKLKQTHRLRLVK